jgi:hypothetical protein
MMNIWDRLGAHYKRACEHYGEDNVLGVFLYGSQNYNTHTENSDVDTKCILIPDLYHLACKPYDTNHLSVDGEICECMTIQHMVANWKKQNINFVEIMFTPYCIINSKFEQTWDNFLNLYREKIARYDVKKAILSMGHQALHTYKQDPSNFKKQMNMLRIRASLLRLIDGGFDYWRIIHMDDETAAELRLVREFGATNEQIGDAKADLLYFIEMADNYSTPELEKDELDFLLDNFIMELIAHRLLM